MHGQYASSEHSCCSLQWKSVTSTWLQDHEDLSGGLFEDEDTRVFYEDLPDLRDLVPEVRPPRQHLLLISLWTRTPV